MIVTVTRMGLILIERFSLKAEILNAFRLLGLLLRRHQAPKLASRHHIVPAGLGSWNANIDFC